MLSWRIVGLIMRIKIKSNIILEGSRHPNFMNLFEYGKLFHNKSFPKRIETLTPPNPKIELSKFL